MVMFFIFLLQIFVFIFSEETKYKIIIDKLSKKSITASIDFEHCIQKKSEKNFHYRGRPKKMSEIIKNEKLEKNLMINNTIKYTKHKVVYIDKQSELDYIYYFPNSTIFLVNGNINSSSANEDIFDPNYCFFIKDKFQFNKLTFSYVIINKEISGVCVSLIGVSLIFFYIINIVFFVLFAIKTLRRKIILLLYVYKFVNIVLGLTFAILFSCFLIISCYLSSILYSLYKSYMFLNLIILLNGFTIIHNKFTFKQNLKYGLFIFIFETITNYIFTYIMFFIPSFDNFYLFFTRNIIEYCSLLIYMIIMIKDIGYTLYRLFKLERRLRTILYLTYKLKFIIYTKILILVFLYCFTFIIFHIILISTKIGNYSDGLFYYYLIIMAIEAFFSIILYIMFYPSKFSFAYFFRINLNYDSILFIAEIKQEKENDMNISKLTKKKLDKEYKAKEYPIALIGPFTKTDNVFKNINFGMVPKQK